MKKNATLIMLLCALAMGMAVASAEITHRYSFNGDVNDSIGSADGTLVNTTGNAKFQDGQLILGNTGAQNSNADPLDGDYVDLPNGMISANGNQATFEFWVTWSGPGGSNWQEFMSFGTSDAGEDIASGAPNSTYIMLTPRAGNGGNDLRCGYRYGPTANERVIDHSETMPIDKEQHVVVVWDGANTTVQLYVNGILSAEDTATHFNLATDLVDVNNWLGRSQWPDPMFVGSYDEFRIYNHAMNPYEVMASYKAGPDAPINTWVATNPDPADGASEVPQSATLQWQAGSGAPSPIVKHLLYLGTDPNAVTTATPDSADVFQGVFTDTSATVTLQPNTTYYWRVDESISDDVSDPNNLAKGTVWTFNSVKTIPDIITQPSSLFIVAGTTGEFTIEARNAETYQWYKDDQLLTDGGNISGATTATLTISNAQTADMGDYFCVITNSVGDVTSDTVFLKLKKLVAHWALDEGNGEVAGDSSEFGIDLTIEGAGWIGDGASGGALSFNGVDNRLVLAGVGDPNQIPIGNDSYSLTAWVRPTATAGNHGIIGWGNYGSARQVNALKLVGVTRMDNYWWAADTFTTFPPINDGQWHLVAATFDGTTRALYLDGIQMVTDTPGVHSVPDLSNFAIGITFTGEWFKGDIDDVRIYNYGLSNLEVAALWNEVTGKSVCLNQPVYDFNGDCQVNLDDLAIFAGSWLECNLYPDCIQ